MSVVGVTSAIFGDVTSGGGCTGGTIFCGCGGDLSLLRRLAEHTITIMQMTIIRTSRKAPTGTAITMMRNKLDSGDVEGKTSGAADVGDSEDKDVYQVDDSDSDVIASDSIENTFGTTVV